MKQLTSIWKNLIVNGFQLENVQTEIVQQNDSNVTEVAYQVGFNSTSYFIEKFRDSMNMTPLAYKKYKIHTD